MGFKEISLRWKENTQVWEWVVHIYNNYAGANVNTPIVWNPELKVHETDKLIEAWT